MSTQSMQGYSSVAIQVALGDGIIGRQLGRQRSLYAPQVGLEETKHPGPSPTGTTGLNTSRMVPRKVWF